MVAGASEGVSPADVARATTLSRSTALRLLTALEAERLVRVDPASRRYQVGPGVLELAGRYLGCYDVRRIALPYPEELAEASGETVNLAIVEDLDAICIEQIESAQAVRAVNWLGRPLPLHATAVGKSWLSLQREEVIEATLHSLVTTDGRLPACTSHTLIEPRVLKQELARARRNGYAVAREEQELGLVAVAAPVCNHEFEVVATVAVSGPSFRLTRQRVAVLGPLVVAASRRLSVALGAPLADSRAASFAA